MSTRYAVYNVNTAQYEMIDDVDIALSRMAELMVAHYMKWSNDTSCTAVEIDDAGNELWSSMAGHIVVSPVHIQAELVRLAENKKNPPPIPVAYL
jgi:hypothetical protein